MTIHHELKGSIRRHTWVQAGDETEQGLATVWTMIIHCPLTILTVMVPRYIIVHKVSHIKMTGSDSIIVPLLVTIKTRLEVISNDCVRLPHPFSGLLNVLIVRLCCCCSRFLDQQFQWSLGMA